jgi:hypothetical protein
MRWRYDDPPLVWLFVAAFALHIVEEHVGGFAEWFAAVAGRPLPRADFLIINLIALALMAIAARVSTRRPPFGWLAIGIATVALINGLAHLLASLAWASYAPGLITGVLLYLPLAQLALIRAWQQVPRPFFWRGVVAGAVAHVVVTVTAVLLSRAG